MAVLGLIEVLLLGVFLAIVASLLFGASTRRLLFVGVGSVGLLMLAVIGMSALFTMRIKTIDQSVMVELPTRSAKVRELVADKKISADKVVSQISEAEQSEPATPTVAVDRPAWVDAPAGLTEGKYQQTVSAGPCDTTSQCEFELLNQIRKAIADYVDGYIAPGAADKVTFNDSELLKLAGQRWVQKTDTTVGPMMYHHARLSLDDSTRAEMKARWRHDEIGDRLKIAGGVAMVLLAGLASLRGFWQWQTTTRFNRSQLL